MPPASARPSGPAEDPKGGGETAVVLADDLMADIAAALHDRPMQGLVAARMMLELSARQPFDGPNHARGLAALVAAGEQTRDILWAMDRAVPAPGQVQEDLQESLRRAADPDRGLSVEVAFADRAAAAEPVTPILEGVIAAIHDIVVDVAIRGGTVSQVDLRITPDGISATVTTSLGRVEGEQSPWIRLAAVRLHPHSGSLAITDGQEGTRMVRIMVALPAVPI